jgi:hypothetical protein
MRSNKTEPWQEALRKFTQCGSDYLIKNKVIPIDFSGITEDELKTLGSSLPIKNLKFLNNSTRT